MGGGIAPKSIEEGGRGYESGGGRKRGRGRRWERERMVVGRERAAM